MGDPLANTSLDVLISNASQGDAPAMDELLDRYLPGLHGFVRLRAGRMLLGRESSSDLVQSVCREVLQHADRYQHGGEVGFKRWLYKTALRKIARRYEFYNAQKREAGREVPAHGPATSQDDAMGLLDGYGSFCTPSRQVMAGEEVDRIEQAFAGLPEDYREVILLSRLMGLSRKEIAEEMDRTEASVRSLLTRALATLAGELDRDEGDAD